jgi:hypothetical protein
LGTDSAGRYRRQVTQIVGFPKEITTHRLMSLLVAFAAAATHASSLIRLGSD